MNRPSPDRLLKHVQAEEAAIGRGRLKLFFGASPGVGKTYTMLEAARQRKKEGRDVLVGLVETHGRAETAALLEGLDILPRKTVDYKGVTLQEFDLDAALRRRPELLIVDELAHTNAPGSRHARRWQDIEELLHSGINVYTTLNVQHWESLNDVVSQITGIQIRETVPDTFLELAAEVELVDLPPEELLKRLREGKVYMGETAGHAADHFFKPGNLIALRELALRHAAERVDAQMQAFKEKHGVQQVWHVRDRFLVGVTASPMSVRLVRATARMANRLRAEWIVLHVQTSDFSRLPEEERHRVSQTLELAEELGAETAMLTGDNVVEEMLTYARTRNVTKIVLGKPARSRWQEWIQGSLVNEVARKAGDIDLYVISGVGKSFESRRPPTVQPHAPSQEIAWAVSIVAAQTIVYRLFFSSLNLTNIAMLYLLGIVWLAYRFGRRASMWTALLSVLSFDFFFVPPELTFSVSDSAYVLTFIVMLVVGIVISALTGRLQSQTRFLREQGLRTETLYRLSRTLSETPNSKELIQVAGRQLKDYYRTDILLFLPDVDGKPSIAAGDPTDFGWTEKEQGTVQWVFDHHETAGQGTDTLSGSQGLYIPLRGRHSTMGVLGIRWPRARRFDPEEQRLLETLGREIGGALESTQMSEAIGRSDMQSEILALSHGKQKDPPRICHVLNEKRILILSAGLSHEEILKRLVTRLDLPNPARALEAILARERKGLTLVGPHLAVPHARLPALKSIQAALGISREGPIYAYLLFVGPAEHPREHLAFLSEIANLFKSPDLMTQLTALSTPSDILQKLRAIN